MVMSQKYETVLKAAYNEIGALNISNFTNEHVSWIMAHLKADAQNSNLNLLRTEGRKVLVRAFTSSEVLDVDIPGQKELQKFKQAWLDVYNNCLLVLYNDFKELCNRKMVVKRYNEVTTIDNKRFTLPQDITSVNYIASLEAIVVNTIAKIIERANANKSVVAKPESTHTPAMPKIQTPEPRVNVSVIKSPIKREETVVVGMTDEFKQKMQAQKPEPAPVRTNKLEVKPVVSAKKEAEPSIFENAELYAELKGLKIPDHDKLDKDDIEKLTNENASFVLVTCADLSKERNLFSYNAEKCLDAGLTIGAYLNGKAKDSDGALKDVKKILEMLREYRVSGPVIYEINNDYLRSHDSEEDIENIVNAYNGVGRVLTESGYNVLIAVEYDNSVLLERYIKRHNIPVVFPIIYRIVPHELKEVPKNVSIVLMDPQFDNDIIDIKNPQFKVIKTPKQGVKQAA